MKSLAVCVAAQLLYTVAADNHKVAIEYGDVVPTSGDFPQTSTFTHNDILVWRLLKGGSARMQNFPAHYLPGKSQITTPDNYQLPQGSKVKYFCAKGAGPCEVAVFVYECAPCEAKKGTLLQYLAMNGYWRTRCAPTFTTGAVGGIQHRMSAYVKTIAEESDEVITIPSDVEFAAFALSNGGKPDCHSLNALAKCEDETDLRCLWNGAASPKCSLATCVNKGPGGGCDINTCVYEDLKKDDEQKPF